MAHVAISRDFLSRVETKIRIMMESEIRALGEAPKLKLPPDSPVVIKAVWGEHQHLRDVIPRSWKGKNTTLRLNFDTTSTHEVEENSKMVTKPVTCSVDVEATQGHTFDFPPNNYWHSENKIDPADFGHADIKAAIDYGNKRAEIAARWKVVKDKVITFFASCKSMNEAVKLWPDCRIYIDTKDIQRFEVKAVKSGAKDSHAAEVLKGIDTDELVGAAVAARFTGVA